MHLRGKRPCGVLALGLDFVHRGIRVVEQLLRRFAVLGEHGDPDAGRREEVSPRDLEGAPEFGGDLVRDGHRVLGCGQVRQKHREFVPALACDGIAGANAVADALGALAQQFVALEMPVGVVDQLEAVQVDEHHPDPTLPARRLHQGQFEMVLEQSAIGQACQLVVERVETDDLLDALALGDVAGDAVAASECGPRPRCAVLHLVVEGDRRHHHDDRLRSRRAGLPIATQQAQFHRGRPARFALRRGRDLDGETTVHLVDDR